MNRFSLRTQGNSNIVLEKLPLGEQFEAKLMRILIKVEDGLYEVKIVSSVDEAFAVSRQLGGQWWDHIGWHQPI